MGTWADERRHNSVFKAAGMKVAVFSTGGFGPVRAPAVDQVAKVYKNGNFTLISDPKQQWRPDHNGTHAHRTGDGWGRYRNHVEEWTAEHTYLVEHERQIKVLVPRFLPVCAKLARWPHDKLTIEFIIALERAVAEREDEITKRSVT